MAVPNNAAQPGAGWDEAQCVAALAQLEQLKEHIDGLRLAIPRIVEPFHRPPNAPMFKAYSQSVLGSQNDIKNFNQQWHTPEIQAILNHAKESLDADSDLAPSNKVPQYGWIEREARERHSKKRKIDGPETLEEAGIALTDQDIEGVVAEFRKTYPNLKVVAKDNNHTITVQFVAGSEKHTFRVNIEGEANERRKLNSECVGQEDITRCIASRPHPNDLKYLLDMIAAYQTVKANSCAKCGKLLDDSTLFPLARRSKPIAGANGASKTAWEAFHESCLD